jgi:hypothetical protein
MVPLARELHQGLRVLKGKCTPRADKKAIIIFSSPLFLGRQIIGDSSGEQVIRS